MNTQTRNKLLVGGALFAGFLAGSYLWMRKRLPKRHGESVS